MAFGGMEKAKAVQFQVLGDDGLLVLFSDGRLMVGHDVVLPTGVPTGSGTWQAVRLPTIPVKPAPVPEVAMRVIGGEP